MCVFFLLSTQSRLSVVSVVFDFNASLNADVPVSPIMFSVECNKNGRVNCGWMSCAFLLCLLHRSSVVSVVLDFNASPNAVFPVSPISFPF